MNILEAIKCAEQGEPVQREVWKFTEAPEGIRPEQCIFSNTQLIMGEPNKEINEIFPPFLFTKDVLNPNGGVSTWIPQHEDIVATDWVKFSDNNE